ncbi:MAG TPA: hypothetical protein VLW55_01245 [Burkholderiaceae bacterium]|nr:hypothetical protein [Burkholderiaceae bacterium]
MNRFNSTFAVALLCAGFSAGALAQDRSTTTQTMAKSSSATKSTNMQHTAQMGKLEVRNWKAIDKNHDNLIEPSEMEAYLNQKAPSKSSSKTKS